MRIDPIPSEGYYVDEIEGERGQVTCMLWLDANHFLVCEIEKDAVILHKIESYILTDTFVGCCFFILELFSGLRGKKYDDDPHITLMSDMEMYEDDTLEIILSAFTPLDLIP